MSDHTPPENDHIHPLARPFLFLGNKKVQDNFIWIPAIGLVAMMILGFVYPLKHPGPLDKLMPGVSWAVIGFVSYAFVVLASHPLFKLLGREEDYYGKDEMGIEEDPEEPIHFVEGAHHD